MKHELFRAGGLAQSGKRLTPHMAKTLLKKGRTSVLKGFKSKVGKAFSARLKLVGGSANSTSGPTSATIGAEATTDPYDQIHAEGYAYREASNHPDKPIVVAGIWLLWGPCFLALVVVDVYVVANLPAIIREARQMWSFKDYAVAIMVNGACAFLQWVSGTILFRTTRNYLRRNVES